MAGLAANERTLTFEKAKKHIDYTESGDEEEDAVFQPISANTNMRRPLKRRKVVEDESDDEFGLDADVEAAMAEDEGMRGFRKWQIFYPVLTFSRHGGLHCAR